MENDNLESTLLKIIGKFKKLIDEFNSNKKKNISVVLLVGVTGSGKSTIFNFQSGADFIINDKKQLEIKNPSNNFSQMVGGMNSITKEPNFYHNSQNNHLIIDFPGFQDTSGDWDQLLFELLFNKIVTSGPIKIIYVIKNPDSSLPNRGSDLQAFNKQLFFEGKVDKQKQKFNLLLNCYMDDLSDEELQDTIKEELKSVNMLQQIDKILVLRKAKKNDEIKTIFNNEQRQILWQQVEQMQSIQIQPQKLPKSEIISEYLRCTTLKTIEQYGGVLCEMFDNKYTQLTDAQSKDTFLQMEKLLNVIQRDNQDSPLNWFINFTSICEQLTDILNLNNEIVTSSNNFIQIFSYFQQFSDLIKGYDEMKIIKSIAEDQLNKMEHLLCTRLEFLKKAQRDKAKIKNIQKQKNKLYKNMTKKQQQIGELKNQLQNSQIEHEQQITELQEEQEKANQSYLELEVEYEKEMKSQKQSQDMEIKTLQKQLKEIKLNLWNQNQTYELNCKVKDQENQINLLKDQINELKNRSSCQIF